jgi:transcription elongation factor/antiterminator RfaH
VAAGGRLSKRLPDGRHDGVPESARRASLRAQHVDCMQRSLKRPFAADPPIVNGAMCSVEVELTATEDTEAAVGAFQAVQCASTKQAWYAVNIRPHCERKAVANLERQGFNIFLPVQLKTIRHARQFRNVCRPLFPGYLFVMMDPDRDRWRSINSTYGVASLVMSGGRPTRVPEGIVEGLINCASGNGVIRFDQSLVPGQKVKLLTGPFSEFIGTLERLDDLGRVRVLLEMMGGRVPVISRTSELMPL